MSAWTPMLFCGGKPVGGSDGTLNAISESVGCSARATVERQS